MNLLISKCVTAVKVSNFSGHYLRNRLTLDIGVLGYIGIVQHKEHSPEVLSIPPGAPCMYWANKQFLYISPSPVWLKLCPEAPAIFDVKRLTSLSQRYSLVKCRLNRIFKVSTSK